MMLAAHLRFSMIEPAVYAYRVLNASSVTVVHALCSTRAVVCVFMAAPRPVLRLHLATSVRALNHAAGWLILRRQGPTLHASASPPRARRHQDRYTVAVSRLRDAYDIILPVL